MIGKNVLSIDASAFLKGASTSDDVADGGFSNQTNQVNLSANVGVLYAPAFNVDSDTDTRLTGNIIASSPDMTASSPNNRLFVTDDGKAYRYNGTKLTAAGVALTAAQTWTSGFTDIITFLGDAYVTSKAKITRWQNDDTIDGGSYPVSFTNATVPHPALVYENNAYYADKNLLLQQTSAGGVPTTVLTLSSDQIIVALGIDPGSGYMLISTTNTLDVSDTISTTNRLLWYDGNSLKVSKSAIIDDAILGFHHVGGIVFVGFGDSVGYLSGSGVQFLRKLKNVSLDNTQLPYKHHMAHIGSTFYVLDGTQIMAYGPLLPGQRVWYPAWSNNVNSNKPTCLADVGSKKLGIAFATTKFYTLDTSSVATTGTMSFVSNKYVFPRPVYIRGFYVEYADAVANNDNNRSLYYKTQVQGNGYVLLKDPTDSFSALKNVAGSSVYEITPLVNELDGAVKFLQLKYTTDTTNYGLRRILVYYDVAE